MYCLQGHGVRENWNYQHFFLVGDNNPSVELLNERRPVGLVLSESRYGFGWRWIRDEIHLLDFRLEDKNHKMVGEGGVPGAISKFAGDNHP